MCTIIGINESSYIKTTTNKSRVSNSPSTLNFFVLPKLTAKLPLLPIEVSSLKIPADLVIVEPSFSTPQAINIIIGAEVFYNLIDNGQMRPTTHGPILQNT